MLPEGLKSQFAVNGSFLKQFKKKDHKTLAGIKGCPKHRTTEWPDRAGE